MRARAGRFAHCDMACIFAQRSRRNKRATLLPASSAGRPAPPRAPPGRGFNRRSHGVRLWCPKWPTGTRSSRQPQGIVPDRNSASLPEPHRGFVPRPFRPAGWARGPHGQTLLGRVLRPESDLLVRRERVHTPDSDFLDLELGPEPGPEAPIALVLHGLEGSTRRRYMRVAMEELTGRGMWAVGMNFRSCSGEPNLQPRFYHSGEIGDLEFVLRFLRERHPTRPIGALGFSLGGNVLLRFLGEKGDAARDLLGGAAAVSVPYDLSEGSKLLEGGRMGRLYSRYFLRSLQAKARAKEALLAGVVDLERILAARTLREFDDAATAPLHGFASAAEYYREASSGPRLPGIRVPTLLLHALDDPFLPAASVPTDAVSESPWLLGAIHPKGGHVGFVEESSPWRPRFWAEGEAARYLQGILFGDGPRPTPKGP